MSGNALQSAQANARSARQSGRSEARGDRHPRGRRHPPQMSIIETTASPQHKLHWLAEQVLNWSGLPVVHVRPTVLLEGFFLIFTSDSVKESNQIRLPFGEGKTSPV